MASLTLFRPMVFSTRRSIPIAAAAVRRQAVFEGLQVVLEARVFRIHAGLSSSARPACRSCVRAADRWRFRYRGTVDRPTWRPAVFVRPCGKTSWLPFGNSVAKTAVTAIVLLGVFANPLFLVRGQVFLFAGVVAGLLSGVHLVDLLRRCSAETSRS